MICLVLCKITHTNRPSYTMTADIFDLGNGSVFLGGFFFEKRKCCSVCCVSSKRVGCVSFLFCQEEARTVKEARILQRELMWGGGEKIGSQGRRRRRPDYYLRQCFLTDFQPPPLLTDIISYIPFAKGCARRFRHG